MFKRNKLWFNLHLLLACIFLLPILVLCISGSMVSYQDELTEFFNAKHNKVIVEDKELLNMEELLIEFAKQKTDLNLGTIEISSIKGTPVKVRAEPKNKRYDNLEYILNPYTGKIIYENHFDGFMKATYVLHRTLATKLNFDGWTPYGRILTATCTLILVMIILSGMYLYLPLLKHKFAKSFKIDFKAKGYRFLHNVHSALGLWLSLILLLISFTAIYITFDWFKNIVNPVIGLEKVKKFVPPENFLDMSQLNITATTDFAKIKEINEAFEIAKKSINNEFSTMSINLYLMHEKNRFYEFRYWDKDDTTRLWEDSKDIAINMKRKRIMQVQEKEVEPEEFTQRKMYKIVSGLHKGNFFGEAGKLIWCIVSFLFVVFPITGLLMTRHRLKRKKTS